MFQNGKKQNQDNNTQHNDITPYFDFIPNEILIKNFYPKLDLQSMGRFSQTCKFFKSVLEKPLKKFREELPTMISSRCRHSLFLNQGHVKVFGLNNEGQLGISKENTSLFPVELDCFNSIKVKQVATGNWHSLFLLDDGSVWCCGWNLGGQIGFEDKNSLSQPTRLDCFEENKVVQIVAGNYHSLFLLEDGSVYGCGLNKEGQLGLGHKEIQKKPVRINILQGEKIIRIEASDDKSFFFATNGNIFTCGQNRYGELGIGNENDVYHPVLITFSKEIKDLSAGANHTLFLMKDNTVLGYGHNGDAQLCSFMLGDYNYSIEPIKIEGLPNKPIKKAIAGNNQSLFVMEDGTLWCRGTNKDEILGSSLGEGSWIPIQLTDFETFELIDVTVGTWHILGLTKTGELVGCGKNYDGQLGLGDKENRTSPEKIISNDNLQKNIFSN